MQPKEEPAAVPTDEALALAAAGGDPPSRGAAGGQVHPLCPRQGAPLSSAAVSGRTSFREGTRSACWRRCRELLAGEHVSFIAFADLCVTRQILTAVRTSSRKSTQPLNSSVSIDHAAGGGRTTVCSEHPRPTGAECEPETILLQGERRQKLAHLIAGGPHTPGTDGLRRISPRPHLPADCPGRPVQRQVGGQHPAAGEKKLEARIGGSAGIDSKIKRPREKISLPGALFVQTPSQRLLPRRASGRSRPILAGHLAVGHAAVLHLAEHHVGIGGPEPGPAPHGVAWKVPSVRRTSWCPSRRRRPW